jgi:hypothetical protein
MAAGMQMGQVALTQSLVKQFQLLELLHSALWVLQWEQPPRC